MYIPGEKSIIKMWDSLVDRGIGGLLSPHQTRRQGKAETDAKAYEIRALAQAKADAEEILSGRKKIDTEGALVTVDSANRISGNSKSPYHAVSETAAQKEVAEKAIEEINISNTILKTEEVLIHSNTTPDETPLKRDWLTKWKNHAKDITDDDIQELWAKVLAGEVEKSGSYSLRTMELLSQLSKKDAELISLIAQFTAGDSIFYPDKKFLEEQGVYFGTLLTSRELGIISPAESVSKKIPNCREAHYEGILRFGKEAFRIKGEKAVDSIEIPIAKITEVGQEILKLGKFSLREDYIDFVRLEIEKMGYEVKRGTVVEVGDDQFRLDNLR